MKLDLICKKNDEWYTPRGAITPILKYLKPNSTIWCPFDTNESLYVKIFKENGFKVINTHIWNNQDFFSIDIPECDYIISNPPYSLKTEVLKRLYQINKPFMMLISASGIFESKERFELFKQNKCELLIFNKRVRFINPDNTIGAPPFSSWYICKNIFKDNINYDYLED